MTSACPICGAPLTRHTLCDRHWHRLSPSLKRIVNIAWNDGDPLPIYVSLEDAAIADVRLKLANSN